MAPHPFLKSIKPVNLLSFGPNTEEIELRPLNILIGPNGSGKSNLVEIIRLLCMLPEKEPWGTVLQTGGADEWLWQGGRHQDPRASVTANVQWDMPHNERFANEPLVYEYKIGLDKFQTLFQVASESLRMADRSDGYHARNTEFVRRGTLGELHVRISSRNESLPLFELVSDRSVLSQIADRQLLEAGVARSLPEIIQIRDFFDRFEFHQDWEFGADLSARDPVVAGQSVDRLDESGLNLAQIVAHLKDFYRPTFERMNELMSQFSGDFKSLDVRLYGASLQLAIQEESGFSTSAYRLSDGTLRWIALLTILLNPNPAPVTCLDEPELGLHPDAIHVLANLLRDASTRTQLIVTTHSDALVDAFSDDPETVCVCEKMEGSTVIRRLEEGKLKVWLKDYSLGHLWMSGEIGGNRW
ncbi:MAG: AAA family ATPase [Terracidiphilus sp.]